MYTISKRFDFSAAHTLEHLPADHPCARLHGHNYRVEIVLRSTTLNDDRFVLDYRALDPVKKWIDETLDHRLLNTFLDYPTAERIAERIYDVTEAILGDALNGMGDLATYLDCVRVSETPKTWAEFRPEPEQ